MSTISNGEHLHTEADYGTAEARREYRELLNECEWNGFRPFREVEEEGAREEACRLTVGSLGDRYLAHVDGAK